MIQAIGLTSNPRKKLPPAVDDVTFEAFPGHVTALLGGPASGKTTTLRLMLELQPGRGITYFRNRPLHCMPHPFREVGVLLGEVAGHPARTVRGQLRMLCAAAGVAVQRADEVLEVVGLVSLRGERLDTLSRGLDRRLGLACALLADPHTLVLDAPADGLSARESRWLHGILRAHAAKGGTVLFSTDDPKEAAQTADRVVTLDAGRVVADQEVAEFARTRLRPRVAVRTPYAARLGLLLTKEARAGQRSIEVIKEDGNQLSVYGSTCADVGEVAYRHGILVHQLADEVGDMGPKAITAAPEDAARPDHALPSESEPEPPTSPPAPAPQQEPPAPRQEARPPTTRAETEPLPQLPPPITVRPVRGPLRPLRYELYRATGVGTGYVTAAVVLAVSAFVSLFLARSGHTSQSRMLAAWPQELPLPPTALGAGLLGAFAFGDEFRHPALAADRGTVPRRLGLLCAKLVVAAATALVLAFLTVGCDAALLQLVYGPELTRVPADWLSLSASWFGVVAGCAWAGVLAAGIFRSTTAGLAAVVAVPVVVVPLVQKALEGPSARSAAGFPGRLRDLALAQWPFGGERYLAAGVRMIGQPVGGALTLSLSVLLCAYGFTALRNRVR
ncbi:ABC transporter ATP-binding protein [Streptomyces jeddahensis]|uniref:Fluoroquinolones export ATP-binding proteinc n=1 Tax=Streptomyces jeddahensis TaxID=1716141 RepID=A0A177HVQ3_9ACTN|nr:ABC transporter ATP-binding protein [Streptomyces jeddahensis]OAH14667.1 fluoroquinolones export ATP-binding proteinc [Streptomyces jeddahensis]